MLTPFKDQLKVDLSAIVLNEDEMAEEIEWDNDRVLAIVDDVESLPGEMETIVLKKMVGISVDSVNVVPEPEDEIRLRLDLNKVGLGDYWTVEKVDQKMGMYHILFIRYAS